MKKRKVGKLRPEIFPAVVRVVGGMLHGDGPDPGSFEVVAREARRAVRNKGDWRAFARQMRRKAERGEREAELFAVMVRQVEKILLEGLYATHKGGKPEGAVLAVAVVTARAHLEAGSLDAMGAAVEKHFDPEVERARAEHPDLTEDEATMLAFGPAVKERMMQDLEAFARRWREGRI